jgi:hypothetical protein
MSVVIEGYVSGDIRDWRTGLEGELRGRRASFKADDGSERTVAFSAMMRVPRTGTRVRLKANQGQVWLFVESWEYLTAPKGKTPGGFPIRGDNEIESEALLIIRKFSEFTADDFHTLEELIENKGRDRRIIGSILKKFERQGLIKPLRLVHSKRQDCHNRPIMLWTRVVDI